MTTLRCILRRRPTIRGPSSNHELPCSSCSHRLFSNGIVQENDRVVLKRTNNLEPNPILTPRLRPRSAIDLHLRGDQIFHKHIIGRRLRDVVTSKKGKEYRITEPTLGEYTNFAPRIVTPIYPQDAAMIVNLLDLNPTVPGSPVNLDDERLEIFEAGTGQGALTLHLSRAVHAANTPAPSIPEQKIAPPEQDSAENSTYEEDTRETYKAWLETRRAVIHTLDIQPTHSRHAQNVIKDYRNGMYCPNIDFHIGTIHDYLNPRLESSNKKPFLSHAILDLPDCHQYFDIVAQALKPGGSLLVFCPSITQINRCALDVKKQRFPLFLENVIELGTASGVGGREWDVRHVRPRAFLIARAEAAARRKQAEEAEKTGNVEGTEGDISDEVVAKAVEPLELANEDDGWELVCRPKVGHRVVGGGFVGVWKKMYFD